VKVNTAQKIISVGISEMAVSTHADEVLVTYSLGSCVGVSFYDPINHIGALIHCMLPTAVKDQEKGKTHPSMFVDTGITLMLQTMFDLGSKKENLICKVAGAGHPLDDSNMFRIGERNYAILKKILWRNNILIKGEIVGDKTAKTMYLHMDSGTTSVKITGQGEVEI
jgi:chemotaxis protein CheD